MLKTGYARFIEILIILGMIASIAVFISRQPNLTRGFEAKRAWRVNVIGAHGVRLTLLRDEPALTLADHSEIQDFPTSRFEERVERLIPARAVFAPALDVLGMLHGAMGSIRYHFDPQDKVWNFHPEILHTTINPGLEETLGAILPIRSAAIVLSSQGGVLALLGQHNTWRKAVAGRAALWLPMLAQGTVNGAFARNVRTTAKHGRGWDIAQIDQAWRHLGLDQAALALSPRPSGSGVQVMNPDGNSNSVMVAIASIARAYLPFIDHGQMLPLRLTTPSDSSVSLVSEAVIQSLNQYLPRITVGKVSFLIWHPLGQSVLVAWPLTKPTWLVVVTHVSSAAIAPILLTILTNR
jgi:hypothetical protein